MSMERVKRVLLPIGIVLGGVFVFILMMWSRGTAERVPPMEATSSVDVINVALGTHPIRVTGTGMVTPAQQVDLVPQVSGSVTYQNPELISGGRVSANELLIRIDGRDYEAVVAMETSRVARAELDLRLEEGRQTTAQREWELMGHEEAPPEMALRTPHLTVAQTALDAARGGLARASNNLARTEVRAPFNGVIIRENVDIGQVVGPGMVLGTVVGSDQFRVRASIPFHRIQDIQIPGINAEVGSSVSIGQTLDVENTIWRSGIVEKMEGQLDPETGAAQVLVRVDHPLDPVNGIPLFPGTYVSIEILGQAVDNSVMIPRSGVYDGSYAWVVDTEGHLARRNILLDSGNQEEVLVVSGLENGDQVVVSPMAMPFAGMSVVATPWVNP